MLKRVSSLAFGWQEVTFVSTWHNLTYQNLPGLPTFNTSEAATKSLGRLVQLYSMQLTFLQSKTLLHTIHFPCTRRL